MAHINKKMVDSVIYARHLNSLVWEEKKSRFYPRAQKKLFIETVVLLCVMVLVLFVSFLFGWFCVCIMGFLLWYLYFFLIKHQQF